MTTAAVTWPRTTDRLVLRPARAADIDPLLAFRNRPEVQRWLINTVEEPEQFRRDWLASVDDPDDHSCVVELDGQVIGMCYLELNNGLRQPGGPERQVGQIGYIFAPEVAGHGYATEAAAELLVIAFEELRLHRVEAGCFADNLASVRVLEKIGLRREQHGIQDSWHAELGWIDGYTYAMLGSEWPAARRGAATVTPGQP